MAKTEKAPVKLAKFPTWLLWTYIGLYLASGLGQPLVREVLKRAGFTDWRGLLFQITNYLSELLLIFVPVEPQFRGKHELPLWKIILIGLLDCTSLSMTIVGQVFAGSMIFAIVYSTVSVWAALESWIFLRIRINWLQILGIIAGVASSIVVVVTQSFEASWEVFWGSLLVLAGSIGHAFTYVLGAELPARFHISPSRVAAQYGAVGTVELSILFCCICLPWVDTIIGKPVRDAGWKPWIIVIVFIGLFLVDSLHSFSFFYAVSSVGPVLMAVLKCLTAAGVSVVTALTPLCDPEHPQDCITVGKIIALVIACAAISLYGGGQVLQKKREEREEENLLNEEEE